MFDASSVLVEERSHPPLVLTEILWLGCFSKDLHGQL